MDDNNPYSRHRAGNHNANHNGNTNNSNSYGDNWNENDNDNGDDNNFHLRNPYSPQFKRTRQRQSDPPRYNYTQDNSNDSRRLSNPYSQNLHHRQQQQQPIPNQYGNSGTSKLSFSIRPEQPQEYHQQQQQQQRTNAPIEQQQPVEDQSYRNNTGKSDSNPLKPKTTQPQPQDQKVILDQLKDQLDQSNESNFELEASVVALEMELQHTKQTLKEEADREKSKLEHELRLAQQESRRWKLLAQQQQKGNSTSRETVPASPPSKTSSAFSDRLLGDSAGLQPSSPSPRKPKRGVGNTNIYEAKSHKDGATVFNQGSNARETAETGKSHQPRELRQQQRQLQDPPVSRLARKLLEQLQPFNASTWNYQMTALQKGEGTETSKPPSTPSLPPIDVENVDVADQKHANNDDSSIRQILLSIANAGRDSEGSKSSSHNNIDDPDVTLFQDGNVWTEGKLVEWLVKKSSSESSDRYWSTLLFQSPEARKHVVDCVSLGGNASFLDSNHRGWVNRQENRRQQQQYFVDRHKHQCRRRRGRIRPITSKGDKGNDATELEERQQQIRQLLRDPWWSPDNTQTTASNRNYSHRIVKDFQNSDGNTERISSTPSSSIVFRKWVLSLAASKDPLHLQTLRILLAEEAGRKSLHIPVADKDIGTNDGEETNGAWWALCYPSIATTIQGIVYRKLISSINNRNRRNPSIRKSANRSNNSRNASAINGNSRRYRIGRFEDRLARLPEIGRAITIGPRTGGKKEGTTAAMEVDKDDSARPSARDFKQNLPEEGGTKELHSFNSELEEDKVLTFALSVWIGLLQVASSEQLGAYYEDRQGLGASDRLVQKKNKKKQSLDSSELLPSSPCGGLFMVCLLLDLLEELQFVQWMREDDPANHMAFSKLLSTGVLLNERKSVTAKKKKNNLKKNPPGATNKGKKKTGIDERSATSPSPSSGILPAWYGATIAVLSQIGLTREGMRILRSRALDDQEQGDWMGNALDVSIRQLHVLVLHLEDFRTRHGSILRIGEYARVGGSSDDDNDLLWAGDPEGACLLRSVEAWIRLWHQVLMFAQSTQSISFRTLVLDLRDWFTSSCATLLSSDEIRKEIKAMIRWQMDELIMDEEDYEESQRNIGAF